MKGPRGDFLDSLYKGRESAWGFEPDKVVELLADNCDLEGMTTLDLGCGDGRNADFLVCKGSRVIAVDSSGAAIKKLSQKLSNSGASFRAIVGEITDFEPAEPIDNIILIFSLHYLSSGSARKVLHRASLTMKPGGFIALATFVEGENGTGSWLKAGEIDSLFSEKGYETLYYDIIDQPLLYPNQSGPFSLPAERILLQKVSS